MLKSKLLFGISIAIFLSGIIVLTQKVTKSSTQSRSVAFILKSSITDVATDGTTKLTGSRIVYQSSVGHRRTETTRFNTNDPTQKGEIFTTIAREGEGAFEVHKSLSKLVYIADYRAPVYATPDEYRKRSDFLREEQVLGRQVFVMLVGATDQGGVSANAPRFEKYSCPDLNGYWLKEVTYYTDGRQTIINPVSLEMFEPSEDKFVLPPYELDTGLFEYRIQNFRRAGLNTQADMMEKQLQKLRSKK